MVQYGEIYYTDFSHKTGSEQRFSRPAVVIQRNDLELDTAIVCPITTDLKPYLPTRIPVQLKEPSEVMIEQLTYVSKTRFMNKLGEIDINTMDKIILKIEDILIKPTAALKYHQPPKPRLHKRGDIIVADFPYTNEHELCGKFPAMIISNDVGNQKSPVYTVIPIHPEIDKPNLPSHYLLDKRHTGFKTNKILMSEYITTIDHSRILNGPGRPLPEGFTSMFTEEILSRALELNLHGEEYFLNAK